MAFCNGFIPTGFFLGHGRTKRPPLVVKHDIYKDMSCHMQFGLLVYTHLKNHIINPSDWLAKSIKYRGL